MVQTAVEESINYKEGEEVQIFKDTEEDSSQMSKVNENDIYNDIHKIWENSENAIRDKCKD